jgi:hypothetical protein
MCAAAETHYRNFGSVLIVSGLVMPGLVTTSMRNWAMCHPRLHAVRFEKGVDARNKCGHDAVFNGTAIQLVMPGHSRSKSGVLSHAYGPGMTTNIC